MTTGGRHGLDPKRRKQLKAEAKAALEGQSAELRRKLEEAIPVGLDHPDWGRYYRENTARDVRFRANRSKVVCGRRIGRDVLYLPVRSTPDDRDIAVDGIYFRCLVCSDFVPLAAAAPLRCGCGGLTHGPARPGDPVDTPQSAEQVKLIPKAPVFRWWQLWRRLGLV